MTLNGKELVQSSMCSASELARLVQKIFDLDGITSFSFQGVAPQDIEFRNFSGYSIRVFFFNTMKTVSAAITIALYDRTILNPYRVTRLILKLERGLMIIYDLLNKNIRFYMMKILENALRAVERSAAKLLSIRLSILLYEELSGMKPVEEFVYVANREYSPWSHTPQDRNHPLYASYLVSRWAAFVAKHLTRMVVGGFIRV